MKRRDFLRASAAGALGIGWAGCGGGGGGGGAVAPDDAGRDGGRCCDDAGATPDASAFDGSPEDGAIAADGASADGAAPPDAGPGDAAPVALLDATPMCEETEDNLEGPFYREGAPMRSTLVEDGDAGVRLELSGTVRRTDCVPLGGALLDFWQADADGRYDNRGFRFRGKLVADAEGRYRLSTIIPGRYLNGDAFRPAHLHVKVSAPGTPLLTTQLYFEGDPFNADDPFIEAPLVMTLSDAPGGGRTARFDFVLRPV